MPILNFFWQLCLLRRSPEQLPSSSFAAAAIFVTYVIIALMVISIIRPQQGFALTVADVAIGVAIQGGLTWALLQYKGLGYRFRATWSSLLGANAVMLLVLLPVNGIMMAFDNEMILLFADSLIWVCLGWWLAIAGYIYHKAVHISVLQGSVIAFLIELLAAIIVFTLFPR